MSSWSHDSLLLGARRVAMLCAALTALIGAVTLFGWATDLQSIARAEPDAVTTRPNTAVALVLLGLALAAHLAAPERWGRRLGGAATAAGLAIAALTLVEWVTRADLGIDDVLFSGRLHAEGLSPRMGVLATVGLTLCFVALVLDRRRRIDARLADVLAAGTTVIGLIGIVGYVSALEQFADTAGTLRIALGTAIGLTAAGLSVLLATPERGATRLLISEGPGGIVARRLLPAAIVGPIGLNVARLVATDEGVITERAGDWLFAFVLLAMFAAGGLRVARGLDLADVRRRAVEDRLRASEHLARSVTDSANDAIVTIDERGWITLFNPAAERLFGWTAREVLGRPATVLIAERDRERIQRALSEIGTGGDPTPRAESADLHGVRKDGSEFDLELSVALARGSRSVQLTTIARDVSSRNEAAQRVREESALLEAVVVAQGVIAAGTREVTETMEIVAGQACEIIGGTGAVVELPDGEDLVYRAAIGGVAPFLGMRVKIDGSLSGLALRTGETLHCPDTDTDPRVDRDACRRVGVRSMVCVPLRQGGAVLGVLKVLGSEPYMFSARDGRTLQLLGGLAAAAVHRARVERRLAAHHAVSEALAAARSLEAGLSGALRGVGGELGWSLGAVWLADDRDGVLRCAETWHDPALAAGDYLELCSEPHPADAEGLLGAVRGSVAPVWLEHLDADRGAAIDGERAAAARACGIQTLVAVPIVSRGEMLGVVELGARERCTHDTDVLELLSAVATQIGLFVQRRRAEERMANHAANLAAVAEFNQELARTTDPRGARDILVRALRDLTRSDAVALMEPDGPHRLVLTAQVGDVVPADTVLDLEDGSLASVQVFRSGRGRFLTDDYLGTARYNPHGLRSAHLEPLIRDGEVVALMYVGTREARSRDAGGIGPLMRLLASEAAGALRLADLLVRLDDRARTDELTGAANRRGWDEELPRELARAARTGTPITVAILDLDHFKSYNDTYGHPAGDRLLRAAAAGWAARLRSTDLLARYGGEEFAVVLPGCDLDAAGRVAEALRAAVPEGATCSIGVAAWDGRESSDALVQRADAALYAAKAGGRDRVVAAAV